MASPNHDYAFRLLLCGANGVGKSRLIETVYDAGQACRGALSQYFQGPSAEMRSLLQNSTGEPGRGIDCRAVLVDAAGFGVELQLWNSGIFQAHRDATRSLFRGKHAILVVFDVKNERSWMEAKEWCEKVDEIKDDNCLVIIVENDRDSAGRRAVSRQDVISYCRERENTEVFQAAAYDQTSVIKMFQALAKRLIDFTSRQVSHFAGRQDNICLDTLSEMGLKKNTCCS